MEKVQWSNRREEEEKVLTLKLCFIPKVYKIVIFVLTYKNDLLNHHPIL